MQFEFVETTGKIPSEPSSPLSPGRQDRVKETMSAFANSSLRASGINLIEDRDAAGKRERPFNYSHIGLTAQEAERRLEKFGKNELPETVIPKWYTFVSQLWQPMPVLIWCAVIIEAVIGQYISMAILLFVLFANAFIGYSEITKAGDAVAALKRSLRPTAAVKRDCKYAVMDAALLVPGDLVLLRAGSAVPADCRVNEGEIEVDEAALTGESLPVTKFQGSSCKMGSTVVRGEVEATVETTGADTYFGKTAALMDQSGEFSNFQKVLLTITSVLVAISVILCVIIFVYMLAEEPVEEALAFTVVLLVASIPLAIEIVTTTTLALGSTELLREGAIVTRLSAIEDMAGMSILCSDKTGTLTMNKMVIQEETPVFKEGETRSSLLKYAAMATKWWEPPRDALDTLVLSAANLASLDAVDQITYVPFDPIVKRTEATIRDSAANKTYRTTKGAPHVILSVVKSTSNDEAAFNALSQAVERHMLRLGSHGIRSLAVAKTNDDEEWEFLGLLTFLDPPRPDTKQTIAEANQHGVAVKMITGDHLLIARETARVLGMGDYVKNAAQLPLLDPVTKKKPGLLARDYGNMCLAVDTFAQVFPEQKYLIVECLRELGYTVGMMGDGVNDAPALKRADVGVAAHGATDAARAAADIVLTEPGLSTIVEGILIARRIFVRISNFLTYRIAATLQLLVFFFIAILVFKPVEYMPTGWETNPEFPDSEKWPEFFKMPVLMLMLITLLNDGTLIAIGYDNAKARDTPEKWNLRVMFVVSSMLAAVSCVSSLLLLKISLQSWQHGNFLRQFNVGRLVYGQITTAIYLKVSISDFLTLFSARTGPDWFWSVAPEWSLLGAAAVALLVSTVLALAWPVSKMDDVPIQGLARGEPHDFIMYIWVYCVAWFFVQDAVKVFTYYLLKKFNVFGYNDTGKLVLPESALRYIHDNKARDLHSINTSGCRR